MNAASARMTESMPLTMWLGLAAMMFGNFMAVLDVQIVASSIGAIQAGVSASRDEVSWVQTAYLIAEVIGIPLSGYLSRALGTRTLFCTSAAAFAVASVLCACAWDINSLIVFRAMQGFFGAAMIPTTMATLFLVVPTHQQPMASAMVTVVAMIAPSIGPTVGGYISELWGWRALFWINVFPAALVVVAVWRYMRIDQGEPDLLRRVDLSGLIGLALFLGGAVFVLEEGASEGWFESAEIVLWSGMSFIGGVMFFYSVANAEVPIVDLRPFRTPNFSVGVILAFILGIGLYTSVFLTPLFLSSVRNYTALEIGHILFVQGAVMMICGPIMGRYVRQLSDARAFGVAGFLLLALSCWMQAQATSQWGFWELALPQALRGIALTVTFGAIMPPAISSLPTHLVRSGTGLFNTVRNLGGAFGIAFLSTIQTHAFALHRQELYTALDPNNPHVTQMISGIQAHLEQTGAPAPERQALMFYAQILDREALTLTFADLYLTLTIILLFAAVAMFLIRATPPKRLPEEALAAAMH